MPKKKQNRTYAHKLRQRAEGALEASSGNYDDPIRFNPDDMKAIIHDLKVYQIELEMQNDELKRSEKELEKTRNSYFDLYNLAPVGYVTLNDKGLIIETNLTAATLLSKTRSELIKKPIARFILKDDQDIYYFHCKRLFETGEPQTDELRMVRPKRPPFWVRLDATKALGKDGSLVCRVVIMDITDRVQAREALQKAHDELEQKVKERTKELEIQKKSLEDVNTALNVMLNKRDEDKGLIEEKVLFNVKELIEPLLNNMKKSGLNENQTSYMNTLEIFLAEIVSPFSQRLHTKFLNLTLSEIRVANLIKEGKTTKEIADLLNSTSGAIEFHRKNLRKKLGLSNRKENLGSHLMSLLK